MIYFWAQKIRKKLLKNKKIKFFKTLEYQFFFFFLNDLLRRKKKRRRQCEILLEKASAFLFLSINSLLTFFFILRFIFTRFLYVYSSLFSISQFKWKNEFLFFFKIWFFFSFVFFFCVSGYTGDIYMFVCIECHQKKNS